MTPAEHRARAEEQLGAADGNPRPELALLRAIAHALIAHLPEEVPRA